jgi:signal transduction histidine kinase
MGRDPKPAKAKTAAKRPVTPKHASARGRGLDKQLAEARAQQAATAEILRVIGASPTDPQPVFEAIAENGRRLFRAWYVAVFRLDGEFLQLVSRRGGLSGSLDPDHARVHVDRASLRGRAILNRTLIHVADVTTDPDATETTRRIAESVGWRAVLIAPLLRDNEPIGLIVVTRAEPGSFSDDQIALLQTFADQAVIAIENVRLFSETKEALERQTATSEILKVIAGSPTDPQPVFDAILKRAATLCEAQLAHLWLYEGGEQFRLGAGYGSRPDHLQWLQQGLHRIGPPFFRESSPWRVGQVLDVRDTEPYRRGEPLWIRTADHEGMRTLLGVPLVKDGRLVGSIAVYRREVEPFTDQQTALVQTFADQAVIAIENVRLFKQLQTSNRDLTTALDTQTATSDILRVISRSQTDVQPVFDAIVASAVRLLEADSGLLTRIAGDQIEIAALTSTDPAGDAILRAAYPLSRHSDRVHARVIRDRAPLNIADAQTDPRLPDVQHATARARGYRSHVAVPLLRHDEALGAIAVTRHAPGGFTDDEIALLQTFADQAVIAIENGRLLSELQERNESLTQAHAQVSEALEQQTATAEILRVISTSPTDLQPVFETIAENALRLCDAAVSGVLRFDGALIHLAAHRNFSPAMRAIIPQDYPMAPTRRRMSGRAILDRTVVHVPDVLSDFDYPQDVAGSTGWRSFLSVPMLRKGQAIGAVTVVRTEPGPFSDRQIELLKTFADQAVIAIENVRLFKELEAANRELSAASQHKSEFLANMSHELRTPLNAIIGFSEVLSERMFGDLNEKQDEYLKDIHASGQHLLSLINDILDLSKIEAGRMELELSDFHLPTALDSALTLVRERAGRRGIALHLSIDERLGQMRGDERKIRQVLLNLLSNAIKFTPEGGRIEVAAAPRDGAVEVSVTDTGVGIAPEDQEAVFEEFRQVGTADKKVEGTGLGLTLCRKFVELHGGTIWVKSQWGQGSTFTFTVPIRPGE